MPAGSAAGLSGSSAGPSGSAAGLSSSSAAAAAAASQDDPECETEDMSDGEGMEEDLFGLPSP